ncbi:hypothetical protein [Stenotrophomonas pigmentata]|uniref:hypothetical protein n=1 Tax=Stenotrophomonas pigmentata TaxID=3055080 RepID=UPI0026EB89CB|nr:hypothetical protein [Stenotrophomonas sp. 610A2]
MISALALALARVTFTGNGRLKVMLIAHADAVYDRGILEKDAHQKGKLLYGHDLADNKAGIAKNSRYK